MTIFILPRKEVRLGEGSSMSKATQLVGGRAELQPPPQKYVCARAHNSTASP